MAARIAVSLMTVLMVAASTVSTPLYLTYEKAFGFKPLVVTLIYAAYAVGNTVVLLLFGNASDQLGRRRVTYPAILASLLGLACFLAARSLPWLFAARALIGIGTAAMLTTATAWLKELVKDEAVASAAATGSSFLGLMAGVVMAGLLTDFAPAPLRLSYAVLMAAIAAGAAVLTFAPETVPSSHPRARDVLRPQVGLPKGVRGAFISPAVTALISFALVGYYSSLVPGVLALELHRPERWLCGLLAGDLFAVGAAAIVLTQRAAPRRVMLTGLALFLPALALFEWAEHARSLAGLFIGTAIGGAAAGIGYRGSLGKVNELAPEEMRASVLSVYLLFTFIGNSVPVIGVGVLTSHAGPWVAHLTFAMVLAAMAAGGFGTELALGSRKQT